MFDDKFTRYMPGNIKTFGVPWHGLAQQPSPQLISGQQYTMTLPSGRVLPVTASFVLRQGGVLGDSRRYRDPRAFVPTFEPPEQAQADTAGAQWRADMLLPYRYGYDSDSQIEQMYFDGVKGWRVNLSGTLSAAPKVEIRNAITLGLPVTFPRDPALYSLDVSSTDSPPTSRSGYGVQSLTVRILDCTEQGDRLLVSVTNFPSFFRYEIRLFELWEYRLSGQGENITAERELLWSHDDFISAAQVTDNMPDGPLYESPIGTPYWKAAGSTASGMNLTTNFEFELRPLSIGDGSSNTFANFERIITRKLNGRVLGAYYAGGLIKYVTLDVEAQSTSIATATHSLSNSSVGTGFVEGQGSNYNWPPRIEDGLTLPSYTVTSNVDLNVTTTLKVSLKNDGALVSEFIATGTGDRTSTTTRTWTKVGPFNDYRNFDIQNPPGYGLLPQNSSAITASYITTSTHNYDGADLGTRTNNGSGANVGISLAGLVSAVPVASTPENAFQGFRLTVPYYGDPNDGTRVQPCRYNNCMLALMSQTFTSDPNASHFRVGKIACNGLLIPGSFSYQGQQTFNADPGFGLFGAYNAVTGEYVRDRPANCFYV